MWLTDTSIWLCNYCDSVCDAAYLKDTKWTWTKASTWEDRLSLKHKCFNCSERIEGWPSVDTVTDMIAFATN